MRLKLIVVVILSSVGTVAVAEKNLFGTLHGHSNWSIDAFGIGNTSLGPEKAYEFARGDRVTHLNGAEVQLGQPLDFFILSDHIGFVERGDSLARWIRHRHRQRARCASPKCE